MFSNLDISNLHIPKLEIFKLECPSRLLYISPNEAGRSGNEANLVVQMAAGQVKVLLLLGCCALVLVAVDAKGGKNPEKTEFFDIKPSGSDEHHSIKLDNGVTCVFTCAAVGGTNEEWTLSLRRLKKGTYTCVVERPEQVSYLYFMRFAASILDHDVQEAEVFDNSGALLQDEEFVITQDRKSVKHKDGGFQSNLIRVAVTAKKTANS